jgi:hypothetical protein
MKYVRLFRKDGTTKPFDECLECVAGELGNDFASAHQSISLLYKYRNNIAHFYSEEMDVIVFSLLKPNIIFYSRFIKQYFNIDLSKETGLILLPIGFSKPYSPIDFISNNSLISESPKLLKDFIGDILNSTKNLIEKGIDEPIVVDFKISLINEKRVKNADIIAGVNNQIQNSAVFTVESKPSSLKITEDPSAPSIRLTRDKDGTHGTLIHEELSKNLFDEINNVVDTNVLLTKDNGKFVLGENVYYRIYAERDHVENNSTKIFMLAKAALNELYAPFFFWITKLPAELTAQLIFDFLAHIHYPNIRSLIKLTTLLSPKVNDWLFSCLDFKWGNHPQPPTYYWNLKAIVKNIKNQKDRCLLALQQSQGSKIEISNIDNGIPIKELMENNQFTHKHLSQACLLRFDGDKKVRTASRILDTICYFKQIEALGLNVEQEMQRSINWHRMKEIIYASTEVDSGEGE